MERETARVLMNVGVECQGECTIHPSTVIGCPNSERVPGERRRVAHVKSPASSAIVRASASVRSSSYLYSGPVEQRPARALFPAWRSASVPSFRHVPEKVHGLPSPSCDRSSRETWIHT